MDNKHYPLGQSVFVSVKTYKKRVLIYMYRYRVTKKGRVVRATSLPLSQKQFCQLLRIKDKLCKDYNNQMSKAESDKSPG